MYVAFQPVRFIPQLVTKPERALLPHVFTFTYLRYAKVGSLFSVTLSVSDCVVEPHPLDGTVLYVVQTFLTRVVVYKH